MEKGFVWYQLSLKQNIKNLGTWGLVIVMLFLIWVINNVHMPDSANTTVGIYYNDSMYREEIKTTLQEADAQFTFEEYDSATKVSAAVESGEVECGFVLTEDFDKQIERGEWKDVVSCYFTPFSTKTDVAKETLYGALYPIYSRWLLMETEDDIYSKEDPERLQKLLEKHDEYLRGTLFLSFEVIMVESDDVDGKIPLSVSKVDESFYLTQGLVELFVLFAMFLSAGGYGQKETAQIASALLVKEKMIFRYTSILAGGTILAGAGLLAIIFSNESRGIIPEILNMTGLLTIGGLFVLGFSKLFKNRLTYITWVVTFAICFMLLRFGIASYITH